MRAATTAPVAPIRISRIIFLFLFRLPATCNSASLCGVPRSQDVCRQRLERATPQKSSRTTIHSHHTEPRMSELFRDRPPRARRPFLRTRQGPLPVPHDTSRHDLVPATPVCPAGAVSPRLGGLPWAVGGTLPPRALPRSWRTGAFAMRRPPMLLRCSETLAQLLGAAFTRRTLRPGNVASDDQCVRGTLAPRHHAGTNNLLSKALGATDLKAALAPRHYRIPPPGDMPRKALSAASGRRSGSDGGLRVRPPARRTPPRRAQYGPVGAGHLHVGPAGVCRALHAARRPPR